MMDKSLDSVSHCTFLFQLHRKSRLFFKYWHQEQLAKYVERLERAAVIIQKGEHWDRSWSLTRGRKPFSAVPAPPLHLCRGQKGGADAISVSRPCEVKVLIANAHTPSAHPESGTALNVCLGRGKCVQESWAEQGMHMIWLCLEVWLTVLWSKDCLWVVLNWGEENEQSRSHCCFQRRAKGGEIFFPFHMVSALAAYLFRMAVGRLVLPFAQVSWALCSQEEEEAAVTLLSSPLVHLFSVWVALLDHLSNFQLCTSVTNTRQSQAVQLSSMGKVCGKW